MGKKKEAETIKCQLCDKELQYNEVYLHHYTIPLCKDCLLRIKKKG